ncbi:LPS-assembly protein [Silvibacterium bohemicum]|uniref:LPS-assembly protein n=1 Tax=Silvibacterium bohemicum TaxID=1577686 RepID=A0A841K590_9BACT|nr:LPS assembly protein LptD [Silvibacterium bohemicum]MBB6145444.1 LPS-assembly protein [Silvibacterium bohemicum]
MRARNFWCTTLLLLCHPQLWSQALTKQFPPAGPASAQSANGPRVDAPAEAASASASIPDPADADPDDASVSSTIPEAHVVPPPPVGLPVKIEAVTQTSVKTDAGVVYTLLGNVVIHYKDYVISADRATYNQDTGDIVAQGNLRVDGGPDQAHLRASHGTMNPDAHIAHYYDVTGTLGQGRTSQVKAVTNFIPGVGAIAQSKPQLASSSPFAISGKEFIQTGEQSYHVIQGTMTSCSLPNPDWQLIARNFFLQNGVARGKSSVFELKGLPIVHKVPVFYMPYVTHAINGDSRQSGIEIPILGNDTTKGFIFGEEIYFVLGRSADLTVGAQYFSKRGFAPSAIFRLRGRGNDFATFRFQSLLDRLPGNENQGGVDMLFDGRHDFDTETRSVADIEYLSSYAYRQEFEDNYSVAINSEVKSQAFLAHSHQALAESIAFNRYQSFESSAGTVTGEQEITILHVPSLTFDGIDQYLEGTPLMWGVTASGSGLSRTEPGFQTSHVVPRLDVYPHLALPVHFYGWTFRPVVGLRDTFYGKSQNPGPLGIVPTERDATLNRKDFEAGLDFRPPALQRDFSTPWLEHLLGADVRHTLEPDVQYKYVTGINDFDSTLRFDSVDVASNTNELEYSLTQRLFLRHLRPHPCTGDEALGPDDTCAGETVNWLSWQVAQKYFFDDHFGGAITPRSRNVLDTTLDLTGVAFLARERAYSPVISRLRWQTTSSTNLEWDVDYDTKTGRLDSSNIFAAYKHGDYTFTFGDAHLHTLPGAEPASTATATPSGTTTPASTSTAAATETNFNQVRLSAIYGNSIKPGLSTGINAGYDFTLDKLQYGGVQANYNWNCCGLSFEVRRYSLGTVPEHTTYLYNFTLANVGSAGSLSWATRVF